MDWLHQTFDVSILSTWEGHIGYWAVFVSVVVFIMEMIRYGQRGELKWSMAGDSLANIATLAMFIFITYVLIATAYITVFFVAAQYAVFDIPVTLATVFACIVLADLAYYWEHRFLHRVNVGWATHSVHHSSPFFNISVAYRFGPLDGFWPVFFHVPLVLLGFNPFVVLFSELLVQLYQTFLHTEAVRKLPRPFEWVFNTPSHHRVHHGSNEKYLDSNYAGIFIIWDRMFGTFVKEDEPVVYGLVKPIPEINSFGRFATAPFVAFFHGFWRIGKKVHAASSFGETWMALFGPPEWVPKRDREPASSD